jgi:hypothetical protein
MPKDETMAIVAASPFKPIFTIVVPLFLAGDVAI